jgi:hypothetical protein
MEGAEQYRDRSRFGLVAAVVYMAMGALQIAAGVGAGGRWSQLILVEGGPVGGLALVLVGVVFLQGRREIEQGLREGVAFVYVGIVLALFFGGIELARMGANAMGSFAIGGEAYADWSPIEDLSPALYLSALAFVGLILWRRSFDLNLVIPREGAAKDIQRTDEEVET